MKKFLFLIILLIIPIKSNALVVDEIPPIIDVKGIDDNYSTTKTVTKDEVSINVNDQNKDLVYSWTFEKSNISKSFSFDFGISFFSKYKDFIDSLINRDHIKYLSFNYHGNLPSKALININVKNDFDDNEKIELYYYNEESNKLELVDNNITVNDGYVSFEIDHCSDYVLVSAIAVAPDKTSRNLNTIIVGLVILAIVMLSYTMFKK